MAAAIGLSLFERGCLMTMSEQDKHRLVDKKVVPPGTGMLRGEGVHVGAMAHTPGPWRYYERERHCWCVDSKEQDHPEEIGPGTHIVADNITYETNARLIAAAPTMIAALKIAENALSRHPNDYSEYKAVKATIAKAKGQ